MATKKNPRRKGRSLQRQRALDVLYEADLRQLPIAQLPQLLQERTAVSTAQTPIKEYGQQIVTFFCDHADDVDSMIEAASKDWAVQRMNLVDRNILRIGATELMFLDVPVAVLANEVASLAREFSNDNAVGFTMGIMNRIAEIRDTETAGLN